MVFLLLAACQALPTYPAPGRSILETRYDPANPDSFQVDLRSKDLSAYDLRDNLEDIQNGTFDTLTTWPEKQWLPDGFDPDQILETGLNPGLGVHRLHRQGITGQGVSIAIIDQTLYPPHQEYKDRLELLEMVGNAGGVSMHGPAVASLAVGETTGVAPGASLYFIAAEIPTQVSGEKELRDFTYLAQAVRRVMEINQGLPAEEKIRALSLSIGWEPGEPAYDVMNAAMAEARDAGIFVISSNLEETYPGFGFNGLGRVPSASADRLASYEAGVFWSRFLADPRFAQWFSGRLLVPMDSRTYASRMGPQEYEWARSGGWSWCPPYLAGLYALAAQVRPQVTPAEFWQAVVDTSVPKSIVYEGNDIQIGTIVQPVKLIEALQNLN